MKREGVRGFGRGGVGRRRRRRLMGRDGYDCDIYLSVICITFPVTGSAGLTLAIPFFKVLFHDLRR